MAVRSSLPGLLARSLLATASPPLHVRARLKVANDQDHLAPFGEAAKRKPYSHRAAHDSSNTELSRRADHAEVCQFCGNRPRFPSVGTAVCSNDLLWLLFFLQFAYLPLQQLIDN